MFATLTPQVGIALAEHLGLAPSLPVPSFFSSRISFTETLLKAGNDAVAVAAGFPDGFVPKTFPDGSVQDEWGIRSRRVGLYNEMAVHPLAEVETPEDLDGFDFPDPDAPGRFRLAEQTVRRYGNDYAILGDQECTVFEMAWYLVGLEKFLIDLALKKTYVFHLLDRILDISIRQGQRLIALGADVIWTGDDMGDQNGMILSPELWREVFKPRLGSVFSAYRRINPDIRIAYHSCGSILPIIPDLIEIGLDILNPIQPRAAGMDPSFLKRSYGDRLCFFGGIDIQELLPRAAPDQVFRSVQKAIRILGNGGGYISAPAHNIQPDTPVENILAFFDAVKRFSSSPKTSKGPRE
jgi:uroporphyrinogen decarboxylase